MRLVALVVLLVGCGDDGGKTPVDAAVVIDGEPDAAPPPTVTVHIDAHPSSAFTGPFVVLYQDGTAPWAAAPRVTGTDDYAFPVSAVDGKYGVVLACTEGGGLVSYGIVSYYTLAELSSHTLLSPCRNEVRYTLTGTVTGITASDKGRIYIGNRSASITPATAAYMMNELRVGRTDLAATRYADDVTQGRLVDTVAIVRDLEITADAQVDVNLSTQGFALDTHTATMAIGTSDVPLVASTLQSLNKTKIDLGTRKVSPFPILAVPAARLVAGDAHYYTGSTSSSTDGTRKVTRRVDTVGDVTLNLPPYIGVATVSTTDVAPQVLVSATLAPWSGAKVYSFDLAQAVQPGGPSGTCAISETFCPFHYWEVHASTGWLGSPGQITLAFPELTSAPGWSPTFGFVQDEVSDWNVYASFSDALETREARRTGTHAP